MWLVGQRPDVLHVHSLVTGLGLHELRAVRQLGIPIVLTHHLPSLGYVCRQGTLMEKNRTPCDGLASPSRCAACVLVTKGFPAAASSVLASLPLSVSATMGQIPGTAGTALGLVASLERDRAHQRELAEVVDYQVVLNDAGRQIVIANGVPSERVVMNRLGTDHQSVPRKPSVADAPTRVPVRLGCLGRIDPTKGIRELVQAVSSLPKDVKFALEIVGPPGPSGFVRGSTEIAATDGRVTFRAPVPSSEVPALVASWDVLCCPSTWFENGPTVALEAMAVGTPLIASRVGNLAEIVEDGVNGRLVPAGDVRALAAAVRDVAENPGSTIDRWRQSLSTVRSLNQIAHDYQALYARLDLKRARASSIGPNLCDDSRSLVHVPAHDEGG